MSATETVPSGALLPAPLHRPVYVVMAVCAGVFVSLAIRVAGGSQAGEVDQLIAKWVRTRLPEVIIDLIPLADPVPVIVMALVVSSLSLGLGHRRFAALAVAGPLVTGLATTGIKPLVGRTIRDNLAYPSGHTGAMTALGLIAALILIDFRPSAGTITRALMLAAGAIIPGTIMALALLRFSSHYPSDTVGGFCAAVFGVLGCALLIDRVAATSGTGGPRVPNDGDGAIPVEGQ